MNKQAWDELVGIVKMDESSTRRAEWLEAWKAKWVGALEIKREVDPDVALGGAVNEARYMDWLKREMAIEIATRAFDFTHVHEQASFNLVNRTRTVVIRLTVVKEHP